MVISGDFSITMFLNILLVPLFVLVGINFNKSAMERLVWRLFNILIILSILFWTVPDLFIGWLQPFLKKFINAYTIAPLGGTRGLKLLAPEPSYMAYIWIVAIILSREYVRRTGNKMQLSIFWLGLLIAILTNRSLTLLIYLAIYFISRIKSWKSVIVLFGCLLLVGSYPRIYNILNEISQLRPESIRDLIAILASFGSTREISVFIAYNYAFDNFHLLSSNLFFWRDSFDLILSSAGFQISDIPKLYHLGFDFIKPHSWFGLIVLSLGLVPSIILLSQIFWIFKSVSVRDKLLPYFMLLFYSLSSNIVSIFLLFYFLKNYEKNRMVS